MNRATKEFVKELERDDVKYRYIGETDSGKDRMSVAFGGENMSDISVNFVFSEDNEDVALRIFDIVKVPENKTSKMLTVINNLNNQYRFAKFCFDTNDSTIQLEMDVPIRQGSIGPVCVEIMLRAVRICDKCYPELMKALWG